MSEFSIKDLERIYKQEDIMQLLIKNGIIKEKSFIKNIEYEIELNRLQTELFNLQNHIIEKDLRLLIIFEGRDAAGKGGSIRTFSTKLIPKKYKTVALSKPTEVEQKQWYLQRYIQNLPQKGEIAFFDRSWYNRAVVEPVFGFCSEENYKVFMDSILEFENHIQKEGIILIKLFLYIGKDEQAKRLEKRHLYPLKKWKIGPLDEKAQEKWDDYSFYITEMLEKTSNEKSPWVEIKTDSKKDARLQSMRYVLSQFSKALDLKNVDFDPDIVKIYT